MYSNLVDFDFSLKRIQRGHVFKNPICHLLRSVEPRSGTPLTLRITRLRHGFIRAGTLGRSCLVAEKVPLHFFPQRVGLKFAREEFVEDCRDVVCPEEIEVVEGNHEALKHQTL